MKYDVKIGSLRADGAIKAYASVNLNDEFAINGIKVMEGSKGTFISMPNYRTSKGEYKDICFPITKNARDGLEKAVLSAYEQAIQQFQKTESKQDMPTQTQEMSGM